MRRRLVLLGPRGNAAITADKKDRAADGQARVGTRPEDAAQPIILHNPRNQALIVVHAENGLSALARRAIRDVHQQIMPAVTTRAATRTEEASFPARRRLSGSERNRGKITSQA